MRREQLIQLLITKSRSRTYLEIGCYKGKTFFKINAERKLAVDPKFHLEFYLGLLKEILRSPKKVMTISYFRDTSDRFFTKRTRLLNKVSPLDIVFIDGLHTFKASLKDVINTLNYLNEHGVIVLHDCYPPNAAAAMPSEHFPTVEEATQIKGWTGAWCGDVWKTIAYIKQNFNKELDVVVLNTDNGLGIIKPKPNRSFRNLELLDSEINRLDALGYETMVSNAKDMINLIDESMSLELIDSFTHNNV